MSTLSHQRNRIYRATDWTLYRQQRAYLAELFPAIAPAGQPKRPLAVGIKYGLIGANTSLSPAEIKHFLRAYTFGPKYLRTLTVGAWRYDLDGARDGWVSPNEAEHAALSLKTHYEMRLAGRSGLAAVRTAIKTEPVYDYRFAREAA